MHRVFNAQRSTRCGFKTFQDIDGVNANFFNGVAAFHDKQRWQV